VDQGPMTRLARAATSVARAQATAAPRPPMTAITGRLEAATGVGGSRSGAYAERTPPAGGLRPGAGSADSA
jgi:hypothetical protein